MIAVIIPVYNGEKYIAEAVNSVLKQTYKNLKIFVVNDGSKDKTVSILQGINDPRLSWCTKVNEGAASARNHGLWRAFEDENKFTHIAFCDADDIWHEKKLEIQLTAMKSKGCTISYTNGKIIDAEGQIEKTNIGYYRKYQGIQRLLLQNHIPTSSVVVKLEQNFVKSEFLFDTNLVGTEDWDLWIRLGKNNNWLGINQPLFEYRRTSGSVSSFSLAYHYNNFLVLLKHHHTIGAYGDKFMMKCYVRVMSKFFLQLMKNYLGKKTIRRVFLLLISPFYLIYCMLSQTISRFR